MDIVERLREFVELEYVEMSIPATMAEAADEIERLREALKHIAKRGPDGELWNTYVEIWMIAEAALKQKESE